MSRVGACLVVGMALVAGCHSNTDSQPMPAATANGGSNSPPPAGKVAVAQSAVMPTDAELWRLSRDPATVAAGQKLFTLSSCRTCHGPTLTGGAAPNLVDQGWLHGGRPSEVFQTIARGVPSKGMPTWGPALDRTVITQIVAFIFSHHHEGEPIVKQESFTPFTPVY